MRKHEKIVKTVERKREGWVGGRRRDYYTSGSEGKGK